MVGRGDPRRDDRRELGCGPGFDRHRADDAGELHLELDVAVEVEVPEEAVLVVADGRDEADHQPSAAPDLVRTAEEVDVLPPDARVFLVQADGVLDDLRFALLGREHRVEVVDLAEAVTAEGERLGHAPEPPLARVERVLPALLLARVAVGDDHFRDRCAVQD